MIGLEYNTEGNVRPRDEDFFSCYAAWHFADTNSKRQHEIVALVSEIEGLYICNIVSKGSKSKTRTEAFTVEVFWTAGS